MTSSLLDALIEHLTYLLTTNPPVCEAYVNSRFLPRDAMHNRGLSVSVCPSVTFVDSVETGNHIFNFFHRRVATSFQFFRTKLHGNFQTGTPLTGASNAGGVGRNRDSEPISGFIACCDPFQQQVQYISCDRR